MSVATIPAPSWLRRTARQSFPESGKEGWQGGVAGRVGWRARWACGPGGMGLGSGGGQGQVAGRAGVRSGGPRGVDLRNKECSGVSIVT